MQTLQVFLCLSNAGGLNCNDESTFHFRGTANRHYVRVRVSQNPLLSSSINGTYKFEHIFLSLHVTKRMDLFLVKRLKNWNI